MGNIHSEDGAAWLATQPGTIDLIITSPPCDQLKLYGGHMFQFEPMARACADALVPGGVLVWIVADATVDGGETGTSFRQALAFMELGLLLHDTMIWSKVPNRSLMHPRHVNGFEYMFVLSRGRPKTINVIKDVPLLQQHKLTKRHSYRHTPGSGSDGIIHRRSSGRVPVDFAGRSNVWEAMPGQNPCNDGAQHPAAMPYKLALDHVRTWSNPGDRVADPMCGCGTVPRAAIELGRQGSGAEIHAPYAALARQAMEQSVLPGLMSGAS